MSTLVTGLREDRRVYVGNLEWCVSPEEALTLVQSVARVFRLHVPKFSTTMPGTEQRRHPGYLFFEMYSPEDAERVVAVLDNTEGPGTTNRMMKVQMASKTKNNV